MLIHSGENMTYPKTLYLHGNPSLTSIEIESAYHHKLYQESGILGFYAELPVDSSSDVVLDETVEEVEEPVVKRRPGRPRLET